MKALSYLVFTRIKNRILTLKRKPALLVLYIIVFLMIIGSLLAILLGENHGASFGNADKRIILLILASFGILYLGLFTTAGLSTGSTLFTMPDVGLLFTAPVSPKKILVYGLISSMGKALLGALFILFQVTNLKIQFNYGFREIFWLFIIYAVLVLFGQLLSIAVYIFTNQNNVRKKLVRCILYAGLVALALAALYVQRQSKVNIFEALLRTVDSKWFGYIPAAGWTVMFFKGIAGADLAAVLISSGLFLFFGILAVILLTLGDADYYEDVLMSTELNYNRIRAAKEGRNAGVYKLRKVKVRDETFGTLRGNGAVSLANRHMLEMKRKNRLIFIDTFTIVAMVAAGAAGYYITISTGGYIVLAAAVYIQYFMVILGKLKQELSKHYIYLIPDTSLKKVFWGSFTSLMKPVIDGILIFAVFGIMGGTDFLTCIFLGLSYAASGIVFVGFTLLLQRVLGEQPSKLVQAFITLGLFAAIVVPAVIMSFLAWYLLPEALQFLTMLPYIIYCAVFAFLLIFISKDMLDKMEYNIM